MSSLYSDPSPALATASVSYEERLFYEQSHLIGKQVRLLLPIVSLSEILTLYGSFCLEQLRC